MIWITLLHFVLQPAVATNTMDVPPAMLLFESHRQRILTAELDYYHEEHIPEVQLKEFSPRKRYVTDRLAGNHRIMTDRGDEDGVVTRDARGNAKGSSPRHYLVTDRLWMTVEDTNQVEAALPSRKNNIVPDIRTLGAFAVRSRLTIEAQLRDEPGTWREEVDGDLIRVTRTDPGREFTWWLDPARDYNAVRTTLSWDGKPAAESRCTLRQYDGYWFPETVHYFHRSYQRGEVPQQTITVLALEMNEPWHPTAFSLQDIGLSDGATVTVRDEHGTLVTMGVALADGTILEPGQPRPDRAPDRNPPAPTAPLPGSTVDGFESAWERYTREFISLYALDKDQSQKARQILARCQRDANEYVARHRSRLDILEAKIQSLPDSDTSRKLALRSTLQRLLRPIDGIFQGRLKPGLEKLPTRAQRATTRPAAQP